MPKPKPSKRKAKKKRLATQLGPVVGVELPLPLIEVVDELADGEDITRSETIRRLLQIGIDCIGQER